MSRLRHVAAAAAYRPAVVYALVGVIGAGAFLWPFWVHTDTLAADAHSADAPLVAALVGALAVTVVALEVRRGTMQGATVALLGVLCASAAVLRLFDLPGGGNGMFFLVVLAGAAFGARFGLLLGLGAMSVSAVLTGGIGPWLPFQMLVLSGIGAGAGAVGSVTSRLPAGAEVAALAAYAWCCGFAYGALMNLWFWPLQIDGGALSFDPALSGGALVSRYWSFYVATSLAWDAAGALANALLIALTGRPVMRSLRRFAHRLAPVVEMEPAAPHAIAPA
ncbi:MAG: ECF transporter S component [Acidimicrobiia bacterium]|nr:ECF transporter S component [Acidimicrobiia bacterium]